MGEIKVGSKVKLKVGRGEFTGEVTAIESGIATVQPSDFARIGKAIFEEYLERIAELEAEVDRLNERIYELRY
jgi:hypothetical protein